MEDDFGESRPLIKFFFGFVLPNLGPGRIPQADRVAVAGPTRPGRSCC